MRFSFLALVWLSACSWRASSVPVVVVVSANAEWRAVDASFPDAARGRTPWGEALVGEVGPERERVLFLHGGWGKIAAAGSAQYVIDRWHPELLVNLGTCGGFAGSVERFETLLVERTVVYDIVERMGDPAAAIAAYATDIDLGWVGAEPPSPARRATLVSADQDLDPARMRALHDGYGAIAADWESGAIAHVARRNGTRVLILRAVSDVVSDQGSEAYGQEPVFVDGARRVMQDLLAALPKWLERERRSRGSHGQPTR